MNNKVVVKFLVALLLVGATVAVSAPEADAHSRGRSWRHDFFGRRSEARLVLPIGSARIIVKGLPFYYWRGEYYRESPAGYEIVRAPAGAIVNSIPYANRTVVIDGVQYHYYDGVYYKGGPAGYTVVKVAEDAGIPVANPAPQARVASGGQTTVVNIPNANGSYTPVALQAKPDGGYTGPQGEFYPTFPTVEQLAAMYAK